MEWTLRYMNRKHPHYEPYKSSLTFPCFLIVIVYHITNTTPLNTLVILIAHQIPSRPRAVAANSIAPGIRRALNKIPTMDGGTVLPNPLNAPAVVISIHINNWE